MTRTNSSGLHNCQRRVWTGVIDQVERAGLYQCLTEHGFECNVYNDLAQLIVASNGDRPDVLLLDDGFGGRPHMTSGFDILADPSWSSVPIVFMVPRGVPVVAPAEFNAFDVGWIRKPFTCEWIVSHINRIISNIGQSNALRDAGIRLLLSERNPCEGYTSIGKAWEKTGSRIDAIVAYGRAVDLDPRCSEAHYRLGCCLFNDRDFMGAIGSFTSAVAANPTYAETFDMLGVSKQIIGDFGGAIEAWNEAIRHGDRELQSTVKRRMEYVAPP